MKISHGMTDGGVVVGNSYDKYGSQNPLVCWIMRGFNDALTGFVKEVSPDSLHEVGCGEGYWVLNWIRQGIDARGSDFSEKIIALARDNARSAGFSKNVYTVKSIYDLEPEVDSADLIVCCEVLEHLDDPEAGLAALQRVATSYVVLSVPREPIWCVLNLARGKYIANLGNTPGHIQNWSKLGFIRLVEKYFDVIEVRCPLPWTMVLARLR